jgi:hypothetical protein
MTSLGSYPGAQQAHPGHLHGSYRTASARASQYRLELDHLRHSRDNSMRREHELERALDVRMRPPVLPCLKLAECC